MSRANEPAYPAHGSMGEVVAHGLTIREHAAIAALQGLCADPGTAEMQKTAIAEHAVGLADALIAELEKP